MLNCREVAKVRDDSIITLLNLVRYASTKQIAELLFKQKYSVVKARQRLKILTDRKLIKRYKPSGFEYVYYIGDKSQKVYHWLQLTEVYVELSKVVDILDYRPEIGCGKLQPDALVYFQYQGAYWKFFIEIDRDGRFRNKIDTYEEYLRSKEWIGEEWAKMPEELKPGFPRVLIITQNRRQIMPLIKGKIIRYLPFTMEEFKENTMEVLGI